MHFKVVAADARPHLEGKVLRQRLITRGIACTYILLSGVASIIGVTSTHKIALFTRMQSPALVMLCLAP